MNRIAEILKKQGRKQTWLAEMLGKSYNMTNSYTCNRRQPSLEDIFKIASILKVNPTDLINNGEIVNENNVIHSVSERTWTVNEILKQLRPYQEAESAAAWFDMYGR